MKLVFLIDSLQQGGMEKQLIYLANFLNETKLFNIEIVLFNKYKKDNFYEDVLQDDIKISDLSISKSIRIPFFGFQIDALKIARKLSLLDGKVYISYGTNSSYILGSIAFFWTIL